ncbi:hypothetical protein [Nonomuraea glycinis]|uniref:hypothetical protein n=1 Tax=Nonomuraea glycinis TaxID=2047744 RepID=UPI0033AEEF0B
MSKPDLTRPCPADCGAPAGQPCAPFCDADLSNDFTNTDRAETALNALTAFAEASYKLPADRDLTSRDAIEQAASDLVTNLLHLLDRSEIHPGKLLHDAYSTYRAEYLEDEPGDQPPTNTLGCTNGCGTAPGEPCLWGCPAWEDTPATAPAADKQPEPPAAAEQLHRYRLETTAWITGTAVTATSGEARSKLRSAIESAALDSPESGVTIDSLNVEGDIDILDVTPIPATGPATQPTT